MTQLTLTKFPSTRDYDQFKLFGINRDINVPHVRRLKKAILENNLLYLNPIVVTTSGYIVDGQHRREAVKEIANENGEGLLLYYFVVSAQDIDVSGNILATLQMNNRQWQLSDYLKLYTTENYIEYKKLDNFLSDTYKEYQMNIIDLKRAVALTYTGNSHNHWDSTSEKHFKAGNYEFRHEAFSRQMIALLAKYIGIMPKACKKKYFQSALIWTIVSQSITFQEHDYELSRLKAGTTKLAVNGSAIRDGIYALEQMFNFKKGKKSRKYLVHSFDIQ